MVKLLMISKHPNIYALMEVIIYSLFFLVKPEPDEMVHRVKKGIC